jgi:hypothetical protein
MANYIFDNINGAVEMQNPQITTSKVTDHMDGTATVEVAISLGAPVAEASKFKVTLANFYSYPGDQPMKVDVDAWVTTELLNYEV